jgi:hypothetical protein
LDSAGLHGCAGPGYQVGLQGNNEGRLPEEVLVLPSAQATSPPVVRVSDRAQAERRPGEVLAFDWTRLAFCCAVAGEISLRRTTLQEAQRSSALVPLRAENGLLMFAHRRAYPLLVGRDFEVDCRRRPGIRSFSASLPPDLGLRASFGRDQQQAWRPP